MASKPNQVADKKPPAFFIPASYKGNQVIPPISAKTSPTLGIAESGQQLGNNVGPGSRVGTPLGTIGKVASTDSARSVPGKPGSYLLASPSGVLDLSLYNYVPVTEKSAGKHNGQSNSHGLANQDQPDGITHESKLTPTDGAETAVVEKEKKRRRFRRPRRNSKLDRLIRILEDKRVGDDEDGEELEDLQLPRLRKVLNIIFVTLGVCFLLAVITVILYTTIATDTEALNEICAHRVRETEPCQNTSFVSTTTNEIETVLVGGIVTPEESVPSSPLHEDYSTQTQSSYSSSLSSSPTAGSHSDNPPKVDGLPPLHKPPDISINHIDNLPRTADHRESLYPYSLYPGLPNLSYEPPVYNQGNYPWSHRQYGPPNRQTTASPILVDEW